MTPEERRNPKVIDGSRKRRIASGSGTRPQDVNGVLKQFAEAQKMMKAFSGGGSIPGLGVAPPGARRAMSPPKAQRVKRKPKAKKQRNKKR
jgi:signal recognition particle subunit SRP54